MFEEVLGGLDFISHVQMTSLISTYVIVIQELYRMIG